MYVAGFVIPVPAQKMEAYRRWAENGAALFREYGCIEIVESWEDNVPTAHKPTSVAPSRRRIARDRVLLADMARQGDTPGSRSQDADRPALWASG
jgi:uncharacterized protein YbaA (DUF1428 family)